MFPRSLNTVCHGNEKKLAGDNTERHAGNNTLKHCRDVEDRNDMSLRGSITEWRQY